MRTEPFWWRDDRTKCAHTLADMFAVFLGHPMECSRMVVVPGMFGDGIVVVVVFTREAPPLLLLLRLSFCQQTNLEFISRSRALFTVYGAANVNLNRQIHWNIGDV